MKNLKKIDPTKSVIMIIMAIFALLIIYPFYNSILISFMTEGEYMRNPLVLFPKKIIFDSYLVILKDHRMVTGYITTAKILIIGIPYNLFLTYTVAYGLSRKKYPLKKFFSLMVIFTMYFSGGIIPFYMLMTKTLHLQNNLLAVILPYGINTFYMLIMMTYLKSIPESLEESAKMDGANDIMIMFRIYLPLSIPAMATFFLFYSVDRWNEWFYGLLFISRLENWPLQLILREIINSSGNTLAGAATQLQRPLYTKAVQLAAVVITMAPIMMVYPFVQKYFMKGLMIGAVKG